MLNAEQWRQSGWICWDFIHHCMLVFRWGWDSLSVGSSVSLSLGYIIRDVMKGKRKIVTPTRSTPRLISPWNSDPLISTESFDWQFNLHCSSIAQLLSIRSHLFEVVRYLGSTYCSLSVFRKCYLNPIAERVFFNRFF